MSIAVRVLCLIGVFVASANAAEVYVNGVKVTGSLKEQAFQGVNVQFNGTGDVFINAPGIKVEMVNGQAVVATGAPAAATTKGPVKHWIVIKNQQVGHYMMILKVNGAKVGTVASTMRQKVLDISDRLKPGQNEVEVVYLPMTDAPKIGVVDAIEVIVGSGQETTNGPLTLKRVLGTHKHKTGSNGAEAAVIPVQLP